MTDRPALRTGSTTGSILAPTVLSRFLPNERMRESGSVSAFSVGISCMASSTVLATTDEVGNSYAVTAAAAPAPATHGSMPYLSEIWRATSVVPPQTAVLPYFARYVTPSSFAVESNSIILPGAFAAPDSGGSSGFMYAYTNYSLLLNCCHDEHLPMSVIHLKRSKETKL